MMRLTLLLAFLSVQTFSAMSVASQPMILTQEELDDFIEANCVLGGQGLYGVELFVTTEGEPRLRLSTEFSVEIESAASLSCWTVEGPQVIGFEYKSTTLPGSTTRFRTYHPSQPPPPCEAYIDLPSTGDTWTAEQLSVPCPPGREVTLLLLHGSQTGTNDVVYNLDQFEELWPKIFVGSTAVANEDGTTVELPDTATLLPAYPNPFNPSTTIRYAVGAPGPVTVAVYDALGRKVATLVDETRAAGPHEVVFDAGDLPSGTYLYRLETPQGSIGQTMLLVK